MGLMHGIVIVMLLLCSIISKRNVKAGYLRLALTEATATNSTQTATSNDYQQNEQNQNSSNVVKASTYESRYSNAPPHLMSTRYTMSSMYRLIGCLQGKHLTNSIDHE